MAFDYCNKQVSVSFRTLPSFVTRGLVCVHYIISAIKHMAFITKAWYSLKIFWHFSKKVYLLCCRKNFLYSIEKEAHSDQRNVTKYKVELRIKKMKFWWLYLFKMFDCYNALLISICILNLDRIVWRDIMIIDRKLLSLFESIMY